MSQYFIEMTMDLMNVAYIIRFNECSIYLSGNINIHCIGPCSRFVCMTYVTEGFVDGDGGIFWVIVRFLVV